MSFVITIGVDSLTFDGKDAATEFIRGTGAELTKRPELTNLFPYVYSDAQDIPVFVRYSDDMSISEMFDRNSPMNAVNYGIHQELDVDAKRPMINANHNVIVGKKLKRAFIYDRKIIADNHALFRHVENFEKAETIFAYSCIARSMIYSNCTKWELSAYANSNMCGCITEGEIANINGRNIFANCSFVVSVFGEAPATQDYNPYAFSHTDLLVADNNELLNYLYDIENGVYRCGLACTVLSDKAHNAPLGNVERNVIKSKTVIPLGQVFYLNSVFIIRHITRLHR